MQTVKSQEFLVFVSNSFCQKTNKKKTTSNEGVKMPNYNVNLSRFEQNLNDKNAPVKIFKHSSKFIG